MIRTARSGAPVRASSLGANKPRAVAPIGQDLIDGQGEGRPDPPHQGRTGGRGITPELIPGQVPVRQHHHGRVQGAQHPGGEGLLPRGVRPDSRSDQGPGPALGQHHQPQLRERPAQLVTVDALGPRSAELVPVRGGVLDVQRRPVHKTRT